MIAMKIIGKIFAIGSFVLMSLLFVSCEAIYDFALQEEEENETIVVEAFLTNQSERQSIYLTHLNNTLNEVPHGISGASVEVPSPSYNFV